MQSARLFMYVMSFPVKKRVVNPHSASCNFSPRAESHLLEICAGAALGAVRATCAVLHDLLDELAMRSVNTRDARIWLPGRCYSTSTQGE